MSKTIGSLFCALIIVTIAGCASSSIKEYRGPDGLTVKTVKCSSDRSKCLDLASQSCTDGGTYRVVSSESHAGGILADIMPGPVTWYSMTFVCGPAAGSLPDFKFGGQPYVQPPQVVAPTYQRPTTTNCTKLGNSVTCNTY